VLLLQAALRKYMHLLRAQDALAAAGYRAVAPIPERGYSPARARLLRPAKLHIDRLMDMPCDRCCVR